MIPHHIAIIMDGNGRWAKARDYPRFYGHIRGTARVKEIVTEARRLGVKALTLFAFSTENWKRPEAEVNVLWKLLKKYLRREIATMKKNGIRLVVIGEMDRLPADARFELEKAIQESKDGREMTLTFALSYGGRSEILDVTRSLARECLEGRLSPDKIDERIFTDRLWTRGLGDFSDVDLMIRTSGEKRISNYLLWQCSYAEFDFPETYWPDYSVEEFRKTLENFSQRKRRFGGV